MRLVLSRSNTCIWNIFLSFVFISPFFLPGCGEGILKFCTLFLLLGIYIINLKRTWEKILLAARAIAAIENPADICVISARPYGQRAVLKFAVATGSTPVAGRFTPGTFTNQIQVIYFLARKPNLS